MKTNIYTVGFAFDETREHVVLIKKNRPTWQLGMYNGIGGGIELEEELIPWRTQTRKFEEETGVKTSKWNYVGEFRLKSRLLYVYTIKTNDIFNCKTTTDEEVEIFRVDKLPKNLVKSVRWMIYFIIDSNEHSRFQIW